MDGAPRVLLGVSGGIAACKAPDLVRRLRERGCSVRCALSRAGASFVTPLSLEVLSGAPVYGEEYLAPGVGGEELHLSAGEWADVLLLAPATAHLLARLALGLADDFLTTTALAFDGPLVAAPAMHPRMWEHPATRGHVATLAARGVHFVGPVVGPLASGEEGMGRFAEPEQIAAAVEELARGGASLGGPSLAGASLAGIRVLVSAGPTWEPLDPVRFLGNRSSGKMGFALAAAARQRGATVELVAGPVTLPTPPGVARTDVGTALQMREALLARAGHSDLVLMAAAVADYRPRQASPHKLAKSDGVPAVELVANPDILAELGELPGERLLVGFAAETAPGGEELVARAAAKLRRKGAHFLVANDVSRPDIGFGSDWNEVVVLRRDGPPVRLERQPKDRLAGALLDLFAAALPPTPAAAAGRGAR